MSYSSSLQSYHVVPGAPAFSANLADGDKLVTADQGEELTVSLLSLPLHAEVACTAVLAGS
jgi:predicted metalloprotease with PDZ domain